MIANADALRELHRIHKQLADLTTELARGPKTILAHGKKTGILQAAAEDAEAETRDVRMFVDDKNLQLKTREGRIADLRAKLNACSTNKEYQALQEQIAADAMACSVLEDEILEALEKVEERQAAVVRAKKSLAAGQAELGKVTESVNQREGVVKGELKRIEAQLATAEDALPADFKADYQRIVQIKGEDAMAVLDGESCGGCYQRLTINMVSELLMSRVVTCQGCGRMIYPPEDRSIGSRPRD